MQKTTSQPPFFAFFPRFPPEWVRCAPSAWQLWFDRQRQRAALAQLDERLLADIGVNRMAAEAECRKWD